MSSSNLPSDVPWQGLFSANGGNPVADSFEATYPYKFGQFGTFAGPQFLNPTYTFNYQEPTWINLVPGDYSFKNYDLGAYLFNEFADYVGWHCDFISTARITFEHSVGNVPMYMHNVTETWINGNLNIMGSILSAGSIVHSGLFTLNGSLLLNGKDTETEIQLAKTLPAKPFDIKHPTKDGYRLRHISLEGPEIAIYKRGKLKDSTVINLPEFWKGFVDPDSITVSLTPIGSYQELFVEEIQWGQKVIVKNASGGPIHCSYVAMAERIDMDKLVVEYEGESVKDYPGEDWLNMKEVK